MSPLPNNASSASWTDMTGNVLLLHMNEASWNGTAGEVVDSSGSNNNGVRQGSATTTSSGKISNAGSFTTSSDAVSVADSASLDITGSISLEAWVYPTSYGTYDWIIGKAWSSDDSPYTAYALRLTDDGDGLEEVYIKVALDASHSAFATSSAGVPLNVWTHVVGTYDSATGGLVVYVNGQSSGTASGYTSGIVSNDVPVTVGKNNNNTINTFTGRIDEAAVYNRALTAAEVADHYRVQGPLYAGGRFDSRVMDAGASGSWTTLSWVPAFPAYKPLPNNAATETGYASGNANMTNNVLMLHMDDSSGAIQDTSGNNSENGWDGTQSGGVTYSANGMFNTALTFDGTDDRLSIPDGATLSGATGATVETWIYITSAPSEIKTIYQEQTSTQGYARVLLDIKTDRTIRFIVRDSDADPAGSAFTLTSTATVPLNTWTHVAAVFDSVNDSHAVYINGASATSTTALKAIGTSATKGIFIGAAEDVTDGVYLKQLKGTLDELAVFSRALTSAEIVSHYQRGMARIKYQVRSCDDSACSGETFIGSDGTSGTFYSELTNTTTSTPSLSLSGVGDNRYFQYRTYLESDNSSYLPSISSVTIGPAHTSDQTITISDVSVSEAAGTATVTVSMANTGDASTTVDYATSNGTAASGGDYTSASGTLTWTAGQTGDKTFTVTITNDTADEDDETITVTLSNAVNGTISDASGVVTITDNDDAPTISINDVSVAESVGTASFTVSLSAASGKAITVDYATANGTATAGSDYTSASGTLSFAAGETSKSVSITIANDTTDEDDETYAVGLSNAVNASISDNSGTGTITDNDDPPTISINDVSAAESAGTASFTVSLSTASGKAITVDYATANGTATAGSDYTSASGTLSFAAGETSKSASVTITNDTLDENDETYTVALSNASNATISDSSGAGTITDNDDPPTVQFTAASQSGAESAGTMTVTAELSAVSGLAVSVPFTVSGTATGGGTDYSITSSPLNISAGSTTAAITITVVNDSIDESSETVIATIGSPTNATVGATSAHTATITDNDTAGITVTQSGGTTNATEGGATDTIAYVLTSQPAADVVITFVANDQHDLSAVSLTFTSLNWETAQTLTVTATNDAVAEGNHTATVAHTVTSDDSYYSGFSVSAITVNITDDDSAGVSVAESGGATNIAEGGATDSYTVVLTSEPTATVTIAVSTDSESTASPSSLTFTTANWGTAQTVTITAVDDSVAQNNHTSSVTHSAASSDGGYSGIAINTVTASITDNDSAGVTVAESDGSTGVTEKGANDTYTVVLSSKPTANVVITVRSDAQVTAMPATLTFTDANWATAQSVEVVANEDTSIEGTHAGTITHAAASSDANYNGITVASITVSVTEASEEEGEEEEEGTTVETLANAGADRTILSGNSVTLDGSASTGSNISYVWTIIQQFGDGTLSDEMTASATYSAPEAMETQDVTMELTVTDEDGTSSTDQVIVHVVRQAEITGEVMDEPIVGSVGGLSVFEDRGDNGAVTLRIGSAEIELPTEAGDDYTMAVTSEGYLIIGLPDVGGDQGRVYFSQRPAAELDGGISLSTASAAKMAATDGLDSVAKVVDDESAFLSVAGSQAGGGFGEYLSVGDVNEDGSDEILVGAPSTGDFGVVYVYRYNATLIGTIFGSAAHPVSSVLTADYLQSSAPDIFFGPNNKALNANLERQASLVAADERDSASLLIGSAGISGSIDLAVTSVDASLGGGARYQSVAIGDVNGNGEADIVMAASDGNTYIYFGKMAEAATLSISDANVAISGGSQADGFGRIVAVGDVSGDGIADIVIGAPEYGDNLTGAIYVFFGSASWAGSVSAASGMLITGESDDDRIGSDILLADADSDGTNEIYTIKGDDQIYRIRIVGNQVTGEVTDEQYISGGGFGCQLTDNRFYVASPLMPITGFLLLIAAMLLHRKKQHIEKSTSI